jgi:hypothetical protein
MTRMMFVAMVTMIALSMVIAPSGGAEGPLVDVGSHSDGDFETRKDVEVSGTAAPINWTMTVQGEDFAFGDHENLAEEDGNLTFRPEQVFADDFSDAELDPGKWEITSTVGDVSVEGGYLKLSAVLPNRVIGSVRTVDAFSVPDGDFVAEFRMRFTTYGYSGSGGGVSSTTTEPYKSHMSVYNLWESYQKPIYRVIANGEDVLTGASYNIGEYIYTLHYSASEDTYTVYRDGEDLGTFSRNDRPDRFWFGAGETTMYQWMAPIDVDYVNLWSLSGKWTSEPIDIGHYTVLDSCTPVWSSTHRTGAVVELVVRASNDKMNWTEWVPLVDGAPSEPIAGKFLQVQAYMALPQVRRDNANVMLSGIELDLHDPLERVEVRREGGEWAPAEGLEEWRAQVDLVEDENVVEVRVTDTSGAMTTTSVDIIVDTVPPTGTMEIVGDAVFTNSKTLTLALEASDKYGVEYVELSNAESFRDSRRLPYDSHVQWDLPGVQGECWVYARFVDAHGLLSTPVRDVINYDTLPPMGRVVIDGDRPYTPGLAVNLEFTYSDNNQVTRVELANGPDFTDATEVTLGETSVTDWQLVDGSDGERAVHIRVTDVAGNVHIASDTIELYFPKEIGTITIEDGADLTGKVIVNLDIEVPLQFHVNLMQISNNPDFEGATWETMDSERMWFLEEGDGERTVYVRFIDLRDIVSLPISDTIVLDTTPPSIELLLNGGAMYTTDNTVTASIEYDDPHRPVRMWKSTEESFYRIGEEEYQEEFEWAFPARESDHQLWVRVEDEAGNVGEGTAIIHYATIAPRIVIELPDGPYSRTKDRIALEITPTDPYGGVEVQFGFDGDPAEDAPWHDANGRIYAPVPSGAEDGTHRIHVLARNAAGITSEAVVTIKVVLDSVPPKLSIVRPLDGMTIPQRGYDILLELEIEDTSEIKHVAYVVDGSEPREIPVDTLSANVTLDGFGDHTIEVTAEDVAGNVVTGISTFTLEDSEGAVAGGTGALVLVVLVLLSVVGGAAYGMHRLRLPGLRTRNIDPGDGFEEEWDHPHILSEKLSLAELAPHTDMEELSLEGTDGQTEEVAPVAELEDVSVEPAATAIDGSGEWEWEEV